MFSHKCSKMMNLSCWPANLWSFDRFFKKLRSFRTSAISKLEGSEQFSAAGTFYVLGTFAALVLGIATMFVRTLRLSQRVAQSLVFFASRMSAAKRDHFKRKVYRLPSSKQLFFHVSFRGSIHSLCVSWSILNTPPKFKIDLENDGCKTIRLPFGFRPIFRGEHVEHQGCI